MTKSLILTFFIISPELIVGNDFNFTMLPTSWKVEQDFEKNNKLDEKYVIKKSRFPNQKMVDFAVLKPEIIPEHLRLSLSHVKKITLDLTRKSNDRDEHNVLLYIAFSEEGKKRLKQLLKLENSGMAVIIDDRVVAITYGANHIDMINFPEEFVITYDKLDKSEMIRIVSWLLSAPCNWTVRNRCPD